MDCALGVCTTLVELLPSCGRLQCASRPQFLIVAASTAPLSCFSRFRSTNLCARSAILDFSGAQLTARVRLGFPIHHNVRVSHYFGFLDVIASADRASLDSLSLNRTARLLSDSWSLLPGGRRARRAHAVALSDGGAEIAWFVTARRCHGGWPKTVRM